MKNKGDWIASNGRVHPLAKRSGASRLLHGVGRSLIDSIQSHHLQQFARYYLMRLGIGHDLTRVALNPKHHPCKFASETELLALRPELQMIE
jgi:hypothetical protein